MEETDYSKNVYLSAETFRHVPHDRDLDFHRRENQRLAPGSVSSNSSVVRAKR
jgi:hypothetical protein